MAEEEQPRLWEAIRDAVLTVIDKETEYDEEKLSEKLRQYFRRGAKNLDLKGREPWQKYINEFADGVFGSVYAGLGDREWLPEVDFQLCFDLAVQEVFPGRVLKNVTPEEYMEVSMGAADRAIDEQRYSHARWKTISDNVEGKMTTKRVSNAVDEARVEAREAGANSAEEFLGSWITFTVKKLADGMSGNPRDCIDEERCTILFNALVQDNCLPLVLVEGGVPEDGSPMIAELVQNAYAEHPADGPAFVVPKKGLLGKRTGPLIPASKPSSGMWGPTGIKPTQTWGAAAGGAKGKGKVGGAAAGGFKSGFGAGFGQEKAKPLVPRAASIFPTADQTWGAPAKKARNW